MRTRSIGVTLAILGIVLAAAAIAWWWVAIPETRLADKLSCLFAPCTPTHRHIPTVFWIGLLVCVVGITALLALTSDANQPGTGLLTTIGIIDRFTDLTGTVFSWMSIPLVAAVAYEVIARYAFNAPTVWAFDITYMLYAALFMLGAAYALHKGAHIRTDFFWETFSHRKKGWIDSIAYVVFFFPSLIALMLISYNDTAYAFSINETSDQTPWRPILWPFKAVVPLACLLLLIQGYWSS